MSTKARSKIQLSIILPTYNEHQNILNLLNSLLNISKSYDLEILVVDDDSTDGTQSLVKQFAQSDKRVRLINRIGRFGLSSAIKEGLINSTGEIVAVMDSDGQHEPKAIEMAVNQLITQELDLVVGSRFLNESELKGLTRNRRNGSFFANIFARFSLSRHYRHITDYMSGFIVLRLRSCIPFVLKVDVNGFKFLYELLAISRGQLLVREIALTFQPRISGESKLDIAIIWDFLISFLHTITLRVFPRRAISFAIVGLTGVFVQLFSTHLIIVISEVGFAQALPFSVVIAASSNYLINNALTFRAQRLRNWSLIRGLLKFLLVASLPVMANVGLATSFYTFITPSELWAQMSGIVVVFVWNYAASSRFVWNTPS